MRERDYAHPEHRQYIRDMLRIEEIPKVGFTHNPSLAAVFVSYPQLLSRKALMAAFKP
jgi:hypothetical protein